MAALSAELVPFDAALARTVLGWARSPEELDAWASLRRATPEVFARWLAEAGVHPFLLRVEGSPRGYGEVWEDREEDEAELARVIVDPAVRRRGLGRTLIALLADRARALGYQEIWVRVVPTNAAALACYGRAGFQRTDATTESTFNEGQPRSYVWMRLPPDGDGGVPAPP